MNPAGLRGGHLIVGVIASVNIVTTHLNAIRLVLSIRHRNRYLRDDSLRSRRITALSDICTLWLLEYMRQDVFRQAFDGTVVHTPGHRHALRLGFLALRLATTRVPTSLSVLAHLGCNISDNARYTIPPLPLHTACQWVPGTISNRPLLYRNFTSALHTRTTDVFMTIDPATLRGRSDPYLSYRNSRALIPLQEIMASCRFTLTAFFSDSTTCDISGVEAPCAIYLLYIASLSARIALVPIHALSGDHLGFSTTFDAIGFCFWWPTLSRDVQTNAATVKRE